MTIGRDDLVRIVRFVTQRDGRWFEEPDAFRPARFLGPRVWPPSAYLPFGARPRVCIRRSFRLLEASLVLAALLQRLSPEAAGRDAAVPEATFSLRPRNGLPQRWRLRSMVGSRGGDAAVAPIR